jgi:hypothetical protein
VQPGQVVQGTLVVTASPKDELCINSRGIEFYCHGEAISMIKARVRSGKNSHVHTAHGGGEFFRQNAPTIPLGKQYTFAPGSVTRFPFSFQMPPPSPQTPYSLAAHFPSINEGEPDVSFWEPGMGRHMEASVTAKYEIKALAHVAGLFTRNLVAQVDLVIDPVFLLGYPPQHNLVPFSCESRTLIPDCCCECFGTKEITARLHAPKSALSLGEGMSFQVMIQNGSTHRINRATVALQTHFTMQVTSGPVRTLSRRVTVAKVLTDVTVAPNSSGQFTLVFPGGPLVPELITAAFSCSNEILVRLHVDDSDRWVTVSSLSFSIEVQKVASVQELFHRTDLHLPPCLYVCSISLAVPPTQLRIPLANPYLPIPMSFAASPAAPFPSQQQQPQMQWLPPGPTYQQMGEDVGTV